jgi:hypothetical protein
MLPEIKIKVKRGAVILKRVKKAVTFLNSKIVEPALGDNQIISAEFVNQPVFFCDASGTIATEITLEHFRLADTLLVIGIAQDILDEKIDALQDSLVGLLTIEIVFHKQFRKRRQSFFDQVFGFESPFLNLTDRLQQPFSVGGSGKEVERLFH